MPKYEKAWLAVKAKEFGVPRDTLEKVYRLRDVLKFFDEVPILRENLALKGGTAINLLFFNLPRLSVDIDLDFCQNTSREEMLTTRKQITEKISKFMVAEGYTLSPKSKAPHSLDSFVYEYINAGEVKDNLKIEINYSLRSHVLPTQRIKLQSDMLEGDFEVNTVAPVEIYASKTVALMTRAAARDLYDMNYMIRYGLFDDSELENYRKCVIFYLAIATETPPLKLDFSAIDTITPHKITTDLKPVIRIFDVFTLDTAKSTVQKFLKDNLNINEKELEFLRKFKRGYYRPELLFDEKDILERVSNHPMAKWKTSRNLDRGAR